MVLPGPLFVTVAAAAALVAGALLVTSFVCLGDRAPENEAMVLQGPLFVTAAAAAALVAGALLVTSFVRLGDRAPLVSIFVRLGDRAPLFSIFVRSGDHALLCLLRSSASSSSPQEDLAEALLHYATTSVVPQQALAEIGISYNVLRRCAACNFLVFGLGRDSLMLSAFNAGGTTVFLCHFRICR